MTDYGDYPEDSIQHFIWERCEADDKRVSEILEKLKEGLEKLRPTDFINQCGMPQKYMNQRIDNALKELDGGGVSCDSPTLNNINDGDI